MESDMSSNRYSAHMQVCKGILNKMQDLLNFTDLPEFNFTSNDCDAKDDLDELDKQFLQLKNAMSSTKEIKNKITNIKSSNKDVMDSLDKLKIIKSSNKEIINSSEKAKIRKSSNKKIINSCEKVKIIKSANKEMIHSSETLKIINSSNKEMMNYEPKNNIKLLYKGNLTNSDSGSKTINSEQLNLREIAHKQSCSQENSLKEKGKTMEIGDCKQEEKKMIEGEYDPEDLPYTASFMSLALTGNELNNVESKVKALCKNKQHSDEQKYNVLRSVFFKERANTKTIDNTCCCLAPVNWTKNLNYENNKIIISNKFANRNNVVAFSTRSNQFRRTYYDYDNEMLNESKDDSDDTSSSGIVDESCNTSEVIKFQPAKQFCYDKTKEIDPYVPSKHSLPFEDARLSFQRLPKFTLVRQSEVTLNSVIYDLDDTLDFNEIKVNVPEIEEEMEEINNKEESMLKEKIVQKEEKEDTKAQEDDVEKSKEIVENIPKSVLVDPSRIFRYKPSPFCSGEIRLCAADETSKCKSVVFQIPKDPNSSSPTQMQPKKRFSTSDKPPSYVCVNEDCEMRKAKLEKLFEQENFVASSENEIPNHSSYLYLANFESELEQKCCNYEEEKEKNIFSQCSQNQVKGECCKSLFAYKNIKGEKSTVIEIENTTKKNKIGKGYNTNNEFSKGNDKIITMQSKNNEIITIESKGSKMIVVQNKRKTSDNKYNAPQEIEKISVETIMGSKVEDFSFSSSSSDSTDSEIERRKKNGSISRENSNYLSYSCSTSLNNPFSSKSVSRTSNKPTTDKLNDKKKRSGGCCNNTGGCCIGDNISFKTIADEIRKTRTFQKKPLFKQGDFCKKPSQKNNEKAKELDELEEKSQSGCCKNQIQPKEKEDHVDEQNGGDKKNEPCVTCRKEICADKEYEKNQTDSEKLKNCFGKTMAQPCGLPITKQKPPKKCELVSCGKPECSSVKSCAEKGCSDTRKFTSCSEKECGKERVREKKLAHEHKACTEFCTPAEIERRHTSVSLISMTGIGNPDVQFNCDTGKCRPRHKWRDWPVQKDEFEVDYEYEAHHIVSFASFRGTKRNRGCYNDSCVESRPRRWFQRGFFSSFLSKFDYCRKRADEKRIKKLWEHQYGKKKQSNAVKFDHDQYEAMTQHIHLDVGSDAHTITLGQESSKRAAQSTMHRLKKNSVIAVLMRRLFLSVVLDAIKKRERKKHKTTLPASSISSIKKSFKSQTSFKQQPEPEQRKESKKKNPKKRKKEHVYKDSKTRIVHFGDMPLNDTVTMETCLNPHDSSVTCDNLECEANCGEDYRESIQTQTDSVAFNNACTRELETCQVDKCVEAEVNTDVEQRLDEATSTAVMMQGDETMWALAYLQVGNRSHPELLKVIYTAPNEAERRSRRNNQVILLRDKAKMCH